MPIPTIKFNSWALAVAKFFDWLKGERDSEENRKRKILSLKSEIIHIQGQRPALERAIRNEQNKSKKKIMEDRLAGLLLRERRLHDQIMQLEAK